MIIKVYIAAMYGQREAVHKYHCQILTEAGFEVTSRWLWEDEPPGSEVQSATKDLEDVRKADALVLLTNPLGFQYSGGGRHVEMGYALGLGKRVYTLGEMETIFCHCDDVVNCSTLEQVISHLRTDPPVSRTSQMLDWCHRTFGPVALERGERAVRLLEEVMELAQCEHITPGTVRRIADRVFSRPPGDLEQEIGQVQNLLECLAENVQLSAEELGRREFARCQAVPQEEWDRRHAEKVAKGTANVSKAESYYGENIMTGGGSGS